MSTFPDMLFHLGGVPVTPSQRLRTGDVYFVDSNTGSDANDGKKLERPFATLDAAIGAATDNNDDTIYVLAKHSETITGAGGITVDKAGLSIIGLGQYDTRPTFLMDGANTVTMLVTSANVTIENLRFLAGHADIAVFATITAKGCIFKNCWWEENVAAENWIIGISAGVADNDYDGLQVLDCTYDSVDTANKGFITLNKDSRDVRISRNYITGQFAASPYAPIYSPSTEVHKNIFVTDNVIHNLHNDNAAVGIAIANTASTGAIVRNLIGHQDSAGETPILAGAAGLFVALNYASGVLGTASGFTYPIIDS